MRLRPTAVSWLLGAFLAAATFSAHPLGADDGGSASDEKPKPKKVDKQEDGDLSKRLEMLEREVRELTALVKKQQSVAQNQPPQKMPPKKPGQEAAGLIKPGFHANHPKQPSKPGVGAGQKPHGPGHDGDVQLVKGRDGQMMVPLAALPPDVQKELLSRTKSGHPAAKGEPKKTAVKKPGAKDDDDDDDDD